jgi:hypothetical protein
MDGVLAGSRRDLQDDSGPIDPRPIDPRLIDPRLIDPRQIDLRQIDPRRQAGCRRPQLRQDLQDRIAIAARRGRLALGAQSSSAFFEIGPR